MLHLGVGRSFLPSLDEIQHFVGGGLFQCGLRTAKVVVFPALPVDVLKSVNYTECRVAFLEVASLAQYLFAYCIHLLLDGKLLLCHLRPFISELGCYGVGIARLLYALVDTWQYGLRAVAGDVDPSVSAVVYVILQSLHAQHELSCVCRLQQFFHCHALFALSLQRLVQSHFYLLSLVWRTPGVSEDVVNGKAEILVTVLCQVGRYRLSLVVGNDECRIDHLKRTFFCLDADDDALAVETCRTKVQIGIEVVEQGEGEIDVVLVTTQVYAVLVEVERHANCLRCLLYAFEANKPRFVVAYVGQVLSGERLHVGECLYVVAREGVGYDVHHGLSVAALQLVAVAGSADGQLLLRQHHPVEVACRYIGYIGLVLIESQSHRLSCCAAAVHGYGPLCVCNFASLVAGVKSFISSAVLSGVSACRQHHG